MTIDDYVDKFYGMTVEVFSEENGIRNPEKIAYKLMVDYDDADDGIKITDRFTSFINDPAAGKVKALIIGSWEEAYDNSPEKLINLMVKNVDKLDNLEALFVGEMTFEECEISWIIQSDYTDLLKAYTNLEFLQIRGASDLSIGPANHNNLKSLIIESGGLPKKIIEEIINCKMPELNHLELWLGTDNYGFDGDINIIKKLVENNPFPQLSYLGFKNSEIADDIAEYLANNSILDRIDILDLSLGNLSDRGAKALLSGSKVSSLKKLDLHHHYISDSVLSKFDTLGISVDISDQMEEDEYDGEVERYIYVSE